MSTLEVSDLTKAYGATKVLESISFTLSPGGCTALIGPNGAGKSTLVECIAGLRRIDRGRVSIDHHDVTDDIQALRSLLYICMQKQPAAKYVRVGEMIDLMRKHDDFHGAVLPPVHALRPLHSLSAAAPEVSERCVLPSGAPYLQRFSGIHFGYRADLPAEAVRRDTRRLYGGVFDSAAGISQGFEVFV